MRILVLVIAALAACGSKSLEKDSRSLTAKLEKLVDIHVADEDRAARVKAELAGIQGILDDFYVELQEHRDTAFMLSRRWETTDAEFERHRASVREWRTRKSEALIAHAMEARKHATEEEWTSITTKILDWYKAG
jgi:hypothetical protein